MEIKAFLQTGQSAPARLLIAPSLLHHAFKLGRKQSADGSILLGGEHPGFAKQACFDLQGNI